MSECESQLNLVSARLVITFVFWYPSPINACHGLMYPISLVPSLRLRWRYVGGRRRPKTVLPHHLWTVSVDTTPMEAPTPPLPRIKRIWRILHLFGSNSAPLFAHLPLNLIMLSRVCCRFPTNFRMTCTHYMHMSRKIKLYLRRNSTIHGTIPFLLNSRLRFLE